MGVEIVGPTAELFVDLGDRYLFEDSSFVSYDEAAAAQVERLATFLEHV